MKIKSKVYEKLIGCPKVPPEMVGILAGRNSIIDDVIFDIGKTECRAGITYVPDVKFLNLCLLNLYHAQKGLLGIFHTHAYIWDSLSYEDKMYIDTIMRAMPPEIDLLYFPLVFPGCSVKSFKAIRDKSQIRIMEDKIKVL